MIWLGYYLAIGVATNMLSYVILRLTGRDTGTVTTSGTFLGILLWPIPVVGLLSMFGTAICLMVLIHINRAVGGGKR